MGDAVLDDAEARVERSIEINLSQCAQLTVEVMVQSARWYHEASTVGAGGLVKAIQVGDTAYELWPIPDMRAAAYRFIAELPEQKATVTDLQERFGPISSITPGWLRLAVTGPKNKSDNILREVFHCEGEGTDQVAWFEPPPVDDSSEPDTELGIYEQALTVTAQDILKRRAGLHPESNVTSEAADAFEALTRASRLYRSMGQWTISRGFVCVLSVDNEAFDLTEFTPGQVNTLWAMADRPGKLYPIRIWKQFMESGQPVREFHELLAAIRDDSHPARALARILLSNEADHPTPGRLKYGIMGNADASELSRALSLDPPKRQRKAAPKPPPVRKPDSTKQAQTSRPPTKLKSQVRPRKPKRQTAKTAPTIKVDRPKKHQAAKSKTPTSKTTRSSTSSPRQTIPRKAQMTVHSADDANNELLREAQRRYDARRERRQRVLNKLRSNKPSSDDG